jgi:hypothetical protein
MGMNSQRFRRDDFFFPWPIIRLMCIESFLLDGERVVI